jgi:hypothetical protein
MAAAKAVKRGYREISWACDGGIEAKMAAKRKKMKNKESGGGGENHGISEKAAKIGVRRGVW